MSRATSPGHDPPPLRSRCCELLVEILKRLRQIADEHGGEFRSEGFTRFFAMLAGELDDDYFDDHRGASAASSSSGAAC